MIGLLGFVLAVLASPFKSKMRLEAENAVLRHQLVVLRRGSPVAPGLPTLIAGSLSLRVPKALKRGRSGGEVHRGSGVTR
jgi:hypothetical protein